MPAEQGLDVLVHENAGRPGVFGVTVFGRRFNNGRLSIGAGTVLVYTTTDRDEAERVAGQLRTALGVEE